EFINSTINRVSNNILRYDSNIGAPAAEILFDHVTVNAFGNAGRRPLFDINTPANVTIKNSIIANSVWASDRYKTPAVHADLFRAGNGASVTIQNTNLYNLMNTAVPPAPLIIPAATQTNVLSENLPWTHDTATKDLVIPAGSPLQTASSDAGPIGDLRIKQ